MNETESRIHLYSMPSFLKGVARLIDPFNELDQYNKCATGQEADYYALLSDWLSVGDDIEYAIGEHEKALMEAEH